MHKGEKTFQEKVLITLNDVLNFYRHISSNLQHKGNLVSLQVQTAQFLIVVNPKQVETSFGKKTAQNMDRIDNNPLSIIIKLLKIYW